MVINELVDQFMAWAQVYYRKPSGRPTREATNMLHALRPVTDAHGCLVASGFSAGHLRSCRDQMIKSGLARTTINARINRVKRFFKWAAARELVAIDVVTRLGLVEPLLRGRTMAKEAPVVYAVSKNQLDKTLPQLKPILQSMVNLQLATAMRPGELVAMTNHQINTSQIPWVYEPIEHKSQHLGRSRNILLGPRARAILDPMVSQLSFVPIKLFPYNVKSYRQAIIRACDRAGCIRWSPNQLRHLAATRLRSQSGLDAAQMVLGHASAKTTEIYAELDLDRAKRIVSAFG